MEGSSSLKWLGGGDGPLARFIREQPQPTEGEQTPYWVMEGSKLLRRVLGRFGDDPEAVDQRPFKLVIEQNPNPSLKPGTDAYYCRVLEICGVCVPGTLGGPSVPIPITEAIDTEVLELSAVERQNLWKVGSGGEDRTPDLGIMRPSLYH